MASVLAMLYLVLFSVLAIGFYAGTTIATQVSRNEQRIDESQFAAESTMDWARRQMVRLNITPGGTSSATYSTLCSQVSATLNGTSNMNGNNPSQGVDASGNSAIYIPGATGTSYPYTYHWISIGTLGAVGRVVISVTSSNSIVVKAEGMAGNGSGGPSTNANAPIRAVQFTYSPVQASYVPPPPGILSHGPLSLSNGAEVSGGNVTSTTASGNVPLTMSGGAKIDNNFSYTANTKAPSLSNGASIGGSTIPNVTAPTFPTVNSSIFAAFVPSASAPVGPQVLSSSSTLGSTQTWTNIRIKANSNLSFGNAETLNGVIYIESPNNITFGGGMTINGIIVTDGNYSTPLSGNTITINNGVVVNGVETLNPANFAASYNISTLVTLSGALILAPNYQVVFTGGSRTVNDSIVASEFNISNGYQGTVKGSVIMLDDTSFQMMGGGHITFTTGATSIAGLTGTNKLQIGLTTYAEVSP
jgi:hypothetical protein